MEQKILKREQTTGGKSGRTKDIVKGAAWLTVDGGQLSSANIADALKGCVPDVCLPGFDREKLRQARETGSPGFFYVTNMSDAALRPVARKVTIEARKRQQVPVFFELSFDVRVDPYAKAREVDWDNLSYLQVYQLSKEHMALIWDRIRAVLPDANDTLLRYANLMDAMQDDPILTITTLWRAFPVLHAITWDLPVDVAPRIRGLAIRDASILGRVNVLTPGLGNVPGEWRLCKNAELSEWPQSF
jgi:hypothetical protein